MRVERVAGHSFLSYGLGPAATILDLGLNRGEFATAIAQLYGCRVLGVEPIAELAVDTPDLVEVVTAALGPRDGRVQIFENRDSCATAISSLAERDVRSREVPMLSLSTLLDRYHVDRADLVKVDIEGAEIEALLAAPPEALDRVVQMTVEFHDWLDPSLADATQEVDRRLRAYGFQRLAFSRDTTDVLYVNSLHLRISGFRGAYLLARYKYPRGLVRVARAKLRAR